MHGPPPAAVLASAALALFAVWTLVLTTADIRARRLPNHLLLLATCTTVPMVLAPVRLRVRSPPQPPGEGRPQHRSRGRRPEAS